ncbi:MAG: ATP-dependent helicase [Deltaproteobacteria bacterium]|nr:ATP-dependent helicase [Deltaproteobacteria bacterium]
MTAIVIDSSTVLADFDYHFRVFAGPGAGKTYWLVNHIRNVIRASHRITPASYVSCISYTNVAVSEIIKGLCNASERTEVCTIHSFLYKNVVKPYLHLLKDEAGQPLVNYTLVDGHDEHRPTFTAVKGWLDSVGARLDFYGKQAEIFRYLKSLTWQHDDNTGKWSLKTMRWVKPVAYLPTSKLDSYKSFYWREGIIDHDDVLYFAYRILEEYPIACEFLSMRFPYLFIDEFQDTNPIQTQVVKWLAEQNTLVGVIGDVEQSIYSFQGAKPNDFNYFSLPGQIDYMMNDNWRSTDYIISLLNHVRGDGIAQKGLRQVAGEPVRIYIGDVKNVVPYLHSQLSPGVQLVILTRKNDEASKIRRLDSSQVDDLWDQMAGIDPNRSHFLEHLIAAGEMAKLQRYSIAITKLIRGIRMSKGVFKDPLKLNRNVTNLERRGIAVSLMHFIVNNYSYLFHASLLDTYQQITKSLSATVNGLSLTAIRTGKFRDFAVSTTYGMLADALRLPDETRTTRTIHQAKSSEFSNVLVSLHDKAQIDHIVDPQKGRSDTDAEEKRITYVALSRARDRLSISIPELSEGDEKRLRELGAEVVRLD